MDRPTVAVYEPYEEGIEQLVYRVMNDEEFASWQAQVEAAANSPAPEHPILVAVRSMSDEDKAALRAELGIG